MISENLSKRQAIPIRIQIAIKSGVLFEIVMRTLEQQPDMLVKHLVNDSNELKPMAEDQTDVLILSAAYLYPPPAICRHLWLSNPKLKILVLTPNGDSAVIYRLHLHHYRLKAVAANTLISTIRRVQQLDLTNDRNISAPITKH